MFAVIYFCTVDLGNSSPQLDEITPRGNWQTKKHSTLLPNYFRVLLSTITYSQMEAGVFPGMTNGWMGGWTDE